jgi:hypothetical protein
MMNGKENTQAAKLHDLKERVRCNELKKSLEIKYDSLKNKKDILK